MNRTLLIGFILAGIFGCSLPPSYHMVQFSGQLENLPDEPIELDFFRDYINNDRHIVELNIKDDGSFASTFEVPGPLMGTFTAGALSIPVYLERGFTLQLKADLSSPAADPVFSGEGSAENNFLIAYRNEIASKLTSSIKQEAAKQKDAVAYVHFVDSITERKHRFFNEHIAHRLSGDGFRDFFTTRLNYEKYMLLLNYPMLHQQLNQMVEVPQLPPGYYDFLDEALHYRNQALSNIAFVNFLFAYLDYKGKNEDVDFDGMSRHQTNYTLAGKHLEGLPKQYIQAISISREMNSGDIDLAMTMYDDFLVDQPEDAFRESLDRAIETIKSLWAGNPAPSFVMEDLNGNTVVFGEGSAGDFYGKVVYLKFWASWCGPCMREVPPAAELKERMAGEEDLVFMYVSIDTDETAWRNAVARHGITGVHMRTPGRERGVPALYNVRWIPTFYIIGRDGNIYDHRPPKPSDPEIDSALKTALAI